MEEEVRYLDFDLLIERVGRKLRARVIDSPVGPSSAIEFSPPLGPQALENFLLKIGRPRQAVRRIDSPLKREARKFGGRLYDTVFRDQIGSALEKSEQAANRPNTGLRIRLHLDTPDLADMPWEYLYREQDNKFFSLFVKSPIVRYLQVDRAPNALEIGFPIQILAVVSSPRDYDVLDIDSEWQKLKDALGPSESSGHVKLSRLDSATVDELQQTLQRGAYHVLHFIGHGGFREATDEGVLLFETELGEGHLVSSEDLGVLLRDESSIRLVVLNACEGARGSLRDPFSGTAQTLIRLGIPAVVAMQFEITDTAAVRFARSFYGALAAGFSLDSAVAEARKSIWLDGNETEWGTPVLYMVAPDGRIFNLPKEGRDQAREEHERLANEQDLSAREGQGQITPQGQKQQGRDEVERLRPEEELKTREEERRVDEEVKRHLRTAAAQDLATDDKASPMSKISRFLTSAWGIIFAIVLLSGAISALYFTLNSEEKSDEGVDCSTATHPSSGTDLRTAINDGLREHYSYDGLYVVNEMTMVDGWAYSQAHPQEGEGSGVDRAYLLRHNGIEWVWQWEGDVNPKPGQSGLPSSLPRSVAAALFIC